MPILLPESDGSSTLPSVGADVTVMIDRTSLGLAPLVLTGHDDDVPLGIYGFQPPASQARTAYAPDSAYVHGAVPLSFAWQQALMAFDTAPKAATEAEAQGHVAELRAAIGRLSYTVTLTVNGHAEEWVCDPGSMQAQERTLPDLRHSRPFWQVTIPCYPIPTPGA